MLQRLYDFVQRRPGQTRDQIADHLYADDPTGGANSVHVVSQHVWRLNHYLRPHGMIVRSSGGPGATYRIVPLDPEYDGDDDMTRSIDVAYEAVRARVAAGGPGWWP